MYSFLYDMANKKDYLTYRILSEPKFFQGKGFPHFYDDFLTESLKGQFANLIENKRGFNSH